MSDNLCVSSSCKELTKQVETQRFVNGFKRRKFGADKLIALISNNDCFFNQGTLLIVKMKLNFHLITNGKVLLDIQFKFHSRCGDVFNGHQSPVLGLPVDKMDVGPRQACLLAILLSLF